MKHSFDKFQLHGFLYQALEKMRINQPTAIQEKAIPAILQGQDVIGQSQTGTGKTLAFLLPIIQRIYIPRKAVQALILAPSRELSNQIVATIEKLSQGTELDVLLIQGGVDINRQVQRLKSSPHIIVGTPGRVWDLMQQNKLAAHNAKVLVIDEADTMLEMGFREDIENIVKKLKKQIQFLLFSATLPPKVINLAKSFMKKPAHFEINPAQKTAEGIEHCLFKVGKGNKEAVLIRLLQLYNPYLALVFVKKKEQVEGLVTSIHQAGFEVEGLQGDLEQSKRKQVMKRFREAKTQVLVATDLASRGLDVEGITHVFNYDLPISSDQYVHRTGRTARAAETGLAINLIQSVEEEQKLKQLAEKFRETFTEKALVRDEIVTVRTRIFSQPTPKAKAKRVVTAPRTDEKAEGKTAGKTAEKAGRKASGKTAGGKASGRTSGKTTGKNTGKTTDKTSGITTGRKTGIPEDSKTNRTTTKAEGQVKKPAQARGKAAVPGQGKPTRTSGRKTTSPAKRGK